MKRKLFSILFALVLSFSLVTTMPAMAADWYVDDDTCPGPGSGTVADPFCTIQAAIAAAADGETINVAAGTYTEHIINQFHPYNKSFNLIGAGADVVTWTAPSGQYPLQIDQQSGVSYEISGFEFIGDNAHCIKTAGGEFNYLDIHDNVFETINLPLDGRNGLFMCRNAGVRTSGVSNIKVHDNVFNSDKGICMSNSMSFDIYDNEFNTPTEGIYSGAGCKTGYTVGDHKIYQNDFSGILGDAIKLDYWADGHPSYLVSTIENNNFESISGYGINVTTFRVTENAKCNWWGDSSGPGGVGPGTGNAISNNVAFDPFLTAPFEEAQACPPPWFVFNHFKCYEVKYPTKDSPKFEPRDVLVTDQFGGGTLTVKKPKLICIPCSKDDFDIKNPDFILKLYEIKGPKGAPKFEPLDVVVTDQFGEETLTVKKPKYLAVPALKQEIE